MFQFDNLIKDHLNNFKSINDKDLLSKIKTLASEDRKLQVLFLKHLKEIEKRKLFLELGYSSLFEFVVKDLGYSESTAYRRIEAARLLNEMPELKEKLKSGVLSLNTAAQVQTYFKKIKKQNIRQNLIADVLTSSSMSVPKSGNSFHFKSDSNPNLAFIENSNLDVDLNLESSITKSELLIKLENKSSREVERHLLSLTPEPLLPKEKIKTITAEHTELKLILTEDQKQRLDQLKLLFSHLDPNMTYLELIDHLCQRTLKQLDPALKSNKDNSKNFASKDILNKEQHTLLPTTGSNLSAQKERVQSKTPKSSSRNIPSALKVKIHQRDQGCCSYVNPLTHKQCRSKFQLQIDHIKPYALGGLNDEENLRLLCSAHNRFRAEKTFGGR